MATRTKEAATITLAEIKAARTRTASLVRRTPMVHSAALSKLSGCDVWFKTECLQRTGSFKVRGAGNRLAMLSPGERERGVVAASAGNHAQGVAVAAAAAGIEATVVMPTNAPLAKVEATRSYGADVVLVGHDYAEAAEYANEVAERENGPVLVHAFNDAAVIAGQGTLGLEILEDLEEVANVVIPVGGGGLAGGVALAIKERHPAVRILGVQAAAAQGAIESLAAGKLIACPPGVTLADGVAVAAPGELTLPLLARYIDGMSAVSEEEISQAIVFLLERSKLMVEGAGAVGVAALLHEQLKVEGPTVVVLTGGNLDINVLARIVEHGLSHAGRYRQLKIGLDDKPGRLSQLLQMVAEAGANVINVEHQRAGVGLAVGRVEVDLLLEVRSRGHGEEVVEHLKKGGFKTADRDGFLHFIPSEWESEQTTS